MKLYKAIAVITIMVWLFAVLSIIFAPHAKAQTSYQFMKLEQALGAGNSGTRNGSSDPYGDPHDGSSERCGGECRAIARELELRIQYHRQERETQRILDQWRHERRIREAQHADDQ